MTAVFPVCVPGIGPVPCDHMIVGEAPGREEIEERAPFVGPAGKVLDKALACCGASREVIYITNAFKGDVGPTNRDPTDQELADHHPLLMDEIQCVRPRIVMSLGLISTRALLPDLFPRSNSRLRDVVAVPHDSSVAGIPVIPRITLPHALIARRERSGCLSCAAFGLIRTRCSRTCSRGAYPSDTSAVETSRFAAGFESRMRLSDVRG